MRVEVEYGIPVTANRGGPSRGCHWPDGVVLNIHIDLDPRLSIVRVEQSVL
jgi:hypothetical protein